MRRGSNRKALAAWRSTQRNECAHCYRRTTLEIHHILGGRWGRVDHPANLLLLCRDCHEAIGHKRDLCLWLKHEADPDHWDQAWISERRQVNWSNVPREYLATGGEVGRQMAGPEVCPPT